MSKKRIGAEAGAVEDKRLPDEETTLFVYGTLTDKVGREEAIGREVATAPARIRNYERRRGRHFYLVRRAGAETAGLLILGLTAQDFGKLDRYEEVPRLYTREKTSVLANDGTRVVCWMYVPTERLLDGGA
jgi:gamma-glutamylcyclotransferase (GGCT)/AIG2-like uncharacterized protein YtfP